MTDTEKTARDFGDAVMILMKSPVWSGKTLADLGTLLLGPMNEGRVAVVRQQDAQGRAAPLALFVTASLSETDHEAMLRQTAEPDWAALNGAGGARKWILLADMPKAGAAGLLEQVCAQLFPGQTVWARLPDKDGRHRVAEVAPQPARES